MTGEGAAAHIRPPWIDERLQQGPVRPFRKVHLDFHNTPAVGEVGQEFDAAQFIDTLRTGHVDSIVVFAKDMHGYFYYPSQRGPVHPGLRRDLLGEQVKACRAAGIRAYAYYCVTWDHYLAERHPEWLVFRRDRTTYLSRFDEVPHWTALCLSATSFVDHVLADSRELVERYDIDGIWYDMPLPRDGECYCHRCLTAIRAAGGDPLDEATQRQHKQRLLTDFMRRSAEQARSIRPGIEVDQNNQTRIGLGERAALMNNVDIEALPTGGWGYSYFPVSARYSRNFGVPICGMTGRFAGHWADFGGLKHPRQLQVEVAGIIAQGAQCSIGDQPAPSARLDAAVYTTIGAAYERVERLQPYLEGAAPVVEAAILAGGQPLTDVAAATNSVHTERDGGVLADSVVGTGRLLRDARIQFDVVEPDADLSRYRLIVLPDALTVSASMAASLADYVDDGGAVVAQSSTIAAAGTDRPWARDLALELHGQSPFSVSYMIPTDRLTGRMAPYEYAIYGRAQRWRPSGARTEVLATLGEPAFERGPAHFTSHRHSPFAELTEFAAAAAAGRVAAISFPIGTIYRETGYWVYRELFRAALDAVLPARLIRSSSPSPAEISLTQQRAGGVPRWIVHVVNTTTDVRWGVGLETFDQETPLHDVEIILDVPGGLHTARLADSGQELAVAHTEHGARIVVPRVSVSELVVLEP